MTETEQIKAIAELANLTVDHIECGKAYRCIPKRGSLEDEYELVFDLNSYDAIIGVIQRQPFNIAWRTYNILAGLVDPNKPAALATAAQWSQALLRATGKWK